VIDAYDPGSMDTHRHRRLQFLLGGMLVALVIGVILSYPSGEPAALPTPLESVSPPPGDAVVGQVTIEIDLPVGYVIDLVVDGLVVPRDELVAVDALGVFRWAPGPGRALELWEPGEHLIEVSWDRIPGRLPDPGVFSWRFRLT
jgi:hypothetical protein